VAVWGPWLVAFPEGRGPWGAEQLIKMATGQLPDAYGMRRQPPRQWRHLWDKQRLGLSQPSRLGPNAAS